MISFLTRRQLKATGYWKFRVSLDTIQNEKYSLRISPAPGALTFADRIEMTHEKRGIKYKSSVIQMISIVSFHGARL